MFIDAAFITTGGGGRVRRSLGWAALLVCSLGSTARADQPAGATPVVREARGLYMVSTEFTAPGPAGVALATLTDYENIPRFMPAVKSSRVIERGDGYTIVEQEAVATFMMFSKRIHLALEVRQQPGVVRFTDRSGQSFARYEGTWTVVEHDGTTTIGYRLTAQPSFEVPPFLLKRLLKRDALQMIARLQAEIAARAALQQAMGPVRTDREP